MICEWRMRVEAVIAYFKASWHLPGWVWINTINLSWDIQSSGQSSKFEPPKHEAQLLRLLLLSVFSNLEVRFYIDFEPS